jgi:hypothetical protein
MLRLTDEEIDAGWAYNAGCGIEVERRILADAATAKAAWGIVEWLKGEFWLPYRIEKLETWLISQGIEGPNG